MSKKGKQFRIDIVGKRFGRLLVISDSELGPNRKATFLCDCGNTKRMAVCNVQAGKIVSCGCYGLEQRIKSRTTHGHAGGERGAEYNIWLGMKTRCFNKNVPSYKDYGDRGITICDRWISSFENFLADMGEMPTDKHTLERSNNDGNYEPSNCKWATRKEQARNYRRNNRISINGITLTLVEWSENTGLASETIRHRISRFGWTKGFALSQPVMTMK